MENWHIGQLELTLIDGEQNLSLIHILDVYKRQIYIH